MKKKKYSLYEKYLQDSRENQEKELLAEQKGKTADKIIINKVSTGGKIIEKFVDFIYISGKIIISIVVISLLSFAITILMNANLRETVMSQLINSF